METLLPGTPYEHVMTAAMALLAMILCGKICASFKREETLGGKTGIIALVRRSYSC